MRLERLELRHLTSLAHVVLDLTTLPQGLIAITGENGSGKTTLLESVVAALHRTLPSRGGELLDYATSRDSGIDVRMALDGVGVFRARVNLDPEHRTSDAVLEHQGQPLNDGKVTTYDAVIRQHFPSLQVLLASTVAVQNKRGNFISKKPRERKELFADLLALNHLEAMSQTAKALINLLDASRERVQGRLAELATLTDPALSVLYASSATELQAERAAAQRDRDSYGLRLRDLESDLRTLQATATEHVAATERAATLHRELKTRHAELHQLTHDAGLLETAHEADIAKLYERVRWGKEKATDKTKKTVADLDRRLAENHKLQGQASAIRAARASLDALDNRERDIRERLNHTARDQQATSEERRSREAQLTILSQTETELHQAEQGIQLIATVPFGTKCAEAGCRFVATASAAMGRIPDLRRALADKPRIAASVATSSNAIAIHRAAFETLSAELTDITTERSAHTTLAALVDKVTAAETRIVELTTMRTTAERDLETRLAELTTEHTEGKRDLIARHKAARKALEERADTHRATIERLGTELADANATATATKDGHVKAMEIRNARDETQALWDAAGGTLAGLAVEEASLVAKRREYALAQVRRDTLLDTLRHLDTERVDWQQLHRALGRDGIPVLEMDAAGPRISEFTNTLLTGCFGSRFSVELVTQQAKTSGAGMKESFELLVTDNERGGEPREVSDLSGGEQVIVSEALMNAIALYVNQRSSMPMRTCWRDETTGALDPENAVRYFQMLRQLQALGDYHHIFFVTHIPAIAAQADAQIEMRDGTARILLPPYVDAVAA